MYLKNLQVENFARIKKGNINFGDLTIFIGPQATGKTLLLELIKLIIDYKLIPKVLIEQGFEWDNINTFLQLYFGEGLDIIWTQETKILSNNKGFDIRNLDFKTLKTEQEKQTSIFWKFRKKVFYIPAQRVLVLENGWPKSFDSYRSFDPYVVKEFSETIRRFLDFSFSTSNINISKYADINLKNLISMLNESILNKSSLKVSKKEAKKRLVLNLKDRELPFMVWSAGQREFIPLLLSFYYLTEKSGNKNLVIIEEPEMGLHPKALEKVLIFVLYLLSLGYKVIISTHSSDVLELIWALKNIQESKLDKEKKADYLNKLFEIDNNDLNEIWKNILDKEYKVFFFEPKNEEVYIRDISKLDPFEEDTQLAEWGGLISFPTRVSNIVSELPIED